MLHPKRALQGLAVLRSLTSPSGYTHWGPQGSEREQFAEGRQPGGPPQTAPSDPVWENRDDRGLLRLSLWHLFGAKTWSSLKVKEWVLNRLGFPQLPHSNEHWILHTYSVE